MTNSTVVNLNDGRSVLLSYGVPVAAFIPKGSVDAFPEVGGYVKTARKYSVTTSRHANAFAGDAAQVLADALFCLLVAPVETKR